MNPETSREIEILAQTVRSLVNKEKAGTALHLIDKVLAEDALARQGGSWKKANLLNLRGCALASDDRYLEALPCFEEAARQAPAWAVPLYNQGLCFKALRRWADAVQVLPLAVSRTRSLRDKALERRARWNLGLALAATKQVAEAEVQWRALGVKVRDELGQLCIPSDGPYTTERVWSSRIDPARARVLSVVRYGGCQFSDVVLVDLPGMSGFEDGQGGEGEEEDPGGLVFLEVLEPSQYKLYEVAGGKASPTQAMMLTEEMREAGLHIEVWSLTMRLPKGEEAGAADADGSRPVRAGLILGTTTIGGSVPAEGALAERAEKAAKALSRAAAKAGVVLCCPDLMEDAGDELGAARHRKVLRGLGAHK